MTFPRSALTAVAFLGVAAAVVVAEKPVRGFDFQTSTILQQQPAAAISNVYLFPSPTNPNDVVAVMNVDPAIPAGAGTTSYFEQRVLYTMKFDSNYASETAAGGRPIENLVLQFSFGPAGAGQLVTVYGPSAPAQVGTATKLVTPTGSGIINKSFTIPDPTGPIAIFAGGRADPQFWDVTQFQKIFPDRNLGIAAPSCLTSGACPNGFTTPGTNFFANTNALSIVAEIPKALLGGSGSAVIGYWATTSTPNGQ